MLEARAVAGKRLGRAARANSAEARGLTVDRCHRAEDAPLRGCGRCALRAPPATAAASPGSLRDP
jgi:hypothetical protein